MRYHLLLIFSLALSGLNAQTCQHCKSQNGLMLKSGAADNLRSDTVDVLNYNIYLDFTQMGSQLISGNCQISFKAKMNINTISLDLLQLNIDSVTHSSGSLVYNYNDSLLIVELPLTMNTNETDSITVFYKGSPQLDPSGWGGFYFQGDYAYNLGVGFGSDPHNYGRVWHPCFDNFAERSTYDFTILTNSGRSAYCNGERISVVSAGVDSLITTWKMSDPIPSYLASIAASSYTHVTNSHTSTITGIPIPIWLIAHAADTVNMKNSFVNIPSAITTYEEAYGAHAWNKIGFVLVPFNSGAMEHATNIAYPKATANGSILYETLYAHELAHHWWGDLVTCLTEEEMWINEGMASYSEKLFLEGLYGRDRYLNEMRDNHHSVLHLAHITDNGYYALNQVPHDYTYGEHSYNKGSDVAHTMRGYLGDSLFFEGLQSVINNFAGGNVSSSQFRDQMNTIPGIDVTNYFEDWIFNPGFSHFSINNFEITGSGPYNAMVVVDQKLKGTSSYHTNVPLTITFMDVNFNEHTESIMMTGPFSIFNFQIPFEATFVAINMDENINDATTAISDIIHSTGLKDYPYANSRLTITSITDSVLLRCEHNWVAPDDNNVPPGIVISHERYWNYHGIFNQDFDATMRFEFNGQNNNAGHYDNELLTNTGGQTFVEDSIVLLYRPNAQSTWMIHPNYMLNFTGANTDKKGNAITNEFLAGQYTWGYRTNSVGIKDFRSELKIYPNPADDKIIIETGERNGEIQIEIYDSKGSLIIKRKLSGNVISTAELAPGNYLISVLQDGTRVSRTIIIQR